MTVYTHPLTDFKSCSALDAKGNLTSADKHHRIGLSVRCSYDVYHKAGQQRASFEQQGLACDWTDRVVHERPVSDEL